MMMYFHIFCYLIWVNRLGLFIRNSRIVLMRFVCFVFHLVIFIIYPMVSVNLTISSILINLLPILLRQLAETFAQYKPNLNNFLNKANTNRRYRRE